MDQLQQKAEIEMLLHQKVSFLEREVQDLKISKGVLERVMDERGSLLKTLEDELVRNRQTLTRWENEVARLELALGNKENNS